MSASTGALVRETITIDVGHLSAGQRVRLTELIAEALHRVADPESAPMVLGWTAVTFQQALGRLEAASAGVQANVIREALRQGGFVSREAVYQLAQYPPDRTLRGFTRPANRIVAEMKRAGLVPPDAVEILAASYQTGVQADGFHVHPDLAGLLA